MPTAPPPFPVSGPRGRAVAAAFALACAVTGQAPADVRAADAVPVAAAPDTAAPGDAHAALRRSVVEAHAAWCHAQYAASHRQAQALEKAVKTFLAEPTEANLAAAHAQWTAARAVYGQTEVFRFHDGPIDAIEPLVNAWPVDEAFLDSVAGKPDCGIVHDVARFPNLSATVLVLANERGGETNVCVGWHAIEFLLWGQDLSEGGPGARPARDFADGERANARRRRELLAVTTTLLVRHLGELEAAWAPAQDNFRRTFVADPDTAVRRILTGAVVLSGFELSGERLGVAYETRDQEQEHSCFSDTTCTDLAVNQEGIRATFVRGDAEQGPGLCALLRAIDPALADSLETKTAAALERMRAIPHPFDAALRAEDGSPARAAIRAAIEALDAQTEAILVAGRLLGHELPLKPGG